MKKLLALVLVLMIAVIAATGCSEHESEIAKEQREQKEVLEEYLASQETGGAEDKVPDPDAEEVVVISVYSLADGNKGLKMNMEDVPELDDWELTEKLKEYGVLPSTAQVIDYRPQDGILEYTGVDSLTPRQAQAVLNTFVENMDIEGQVTLLLDGREILKSGYDSDFKNIDDTYTGGADDGDIFKSGPGVQ